MRFLCPCLERQPSGDITIDEVVLFTQHDGPATHVLVM